MQPHFEALRIQKRVIGALILRDMRTRFGRTFFGYVISVGWPLTHLLVIMTVYLVLRRMVPFGTNPAVFLGTGILPYVLCLYPARMIMLSVATNKPLLLFPVVKTFDLILARGLLEIITAFWVITIFCAVLFIFGVDVIPLQPAEAVQAIFATIFLGFSIGFLGAVMYSVTKAWMIVVIVMMIIMYTTSGALYYAGALPVKVLYYMSWNPLFHAVEWLRSAYYEGYGDNILDRGYLLTFAMVNLCLGMALERFIRKVVQSH